VGNQRVALKRVAVADRPGLVAGFEIVDNEIDLFARSRLGQESA